VGRDELGVPFVAIFASWGQFLFGVAALAILGLVGVIAVVLITARATVDRSSDATERRAPGKDAPGGGK
jgi:hypothetical protein